jgi:hypothetical protein
MELPGLEAPPTLIAGVMRRLPAASSAAWYNISWWHWPLALRTISVALVLAVLGCLGWLSGSFGELGLGQLLANAVVELKEVLAFALETAEAFLGSNAVFWREYGQMILIAAASLLLVTYLTCVAAGTALYQLAWKRSL